nr:MAG TPA: hypothetical protein [Caudoviricetes sp.]
MKRWTTNKLVLTYRQHGDDVAASLVTISYFAFILTRF